MHARRRLLILTALSVGAALVVFACSDGDAGGNKLPLGNGDAGKRKDTGVDPDPDPDPNPEPEPLPDSGKPPGRVFAHTGSTLYIFEPIERKLGLIGKFSCLPANDEVLDIAIDQTGNMYGTTWYRFVKINPTDATCTIIKEKTYKFYPNALSFVPQGTLDPQQDALVGYQFDNQGEATYLRRIDLQTGELSPPPSGDGQLNPSSPQLPIDYKCSGDFIALSSNKKAYLTVNRSKLTPDGGTDTDSLAEIDPSTGKIIKIIGDTKHKDIYGFGYANGKGYGFTNTGQILEIDITNGSATVLLTLDGGTPWYGAGVTTDAK
jgi:hypothetical protein